MDNTKEMFEFIEERLGEPLTKKEKTRLEKLARQSELDKRYAFIEHHLGEPLTAKDKAAINRFKTASEKYDLKKLKKQNALAPKWNTQKVIRWCSATAAVSIILCLSIVLPITLSDTKIVHVPDYIYIDNTSPAEAPRYGIHTEIQTLNLQQGALSEVAGLLLFNSSKYGFDEQGEFIYGETTSLISKNDGRILGYTIANGLIAIDFQPPDVMDAFWVDYRIRTYKYYYFYDYYTNFYATLENTYNDNKTDIKNEDNLYEFKDVEVVCGNENLGFAPITINAFVEKGIVVLFYTRENNTYIYFVYGDNDYFIKATPIDSFSGTPDANYIKDEFIINTLFANIE